MVDWYEENIEPEVREVVRLLRDNGINTVCSCGHEKTVQCEYSNDGFVRNVDYLLFNTGYRNYTIDVHLNRDDGHIHSFLNITFRDLEKKEII